MKPKSKSHLEGVLENGDHIKVGWNVWKSTSDYPARTPHDDWIVRITTWPSLNVLPGVCLLLRCWEVNRIVDGHNQWATEGTNSVVVGRVLINDTIQVAELSQLPKMNVEVAVVGSMTMYFSNTRK